MRNGQYYVYLNLSNVMFGGMIYCQYFIVKIVLVMIMNFFSNDVWMDYDDFVRILMMVVDVIIEVEQEIVE